MSDPIPTSGSIPLTIEGPTAGAELGVYDSSFKLLKCGVGELRADLAPGLYDLEAKIAGSSERKSVMLGETAVKIAASDWQLQYRTSAPLPRSSILREGHDTAAQRYSTTVTLRAGPEGPCRLLVFGRVLVRGEDEQWVKTTDPFWREIRLTDTAGHQVTDFSSGVMSNLDEGWCALSVDLAEGGYILSAPAPDGGEYCLPLWLQPNYGTFVFFPVFRQIALDGCSIVMAPKSEGFVPERQTEAEYGDTLLGGFRRAKILVNEPAVRQMLDRKFYNPFAAIIAAYALLQRTDRPVDVDLMRTVVSNLRSALGSRHPDIIALSSMLFRIDPASQTDEYQLSFPPNLRIGFDAVRARSAVVPAVLQLNPVVSEALQNLLPGQYTVWRRDAAGSGPFLSKVAEQAGRLLQKVPGLVQNLLKAPPATPDLNAAVQRFETWIRDKDTTQLASDLGLPPALVESAKDKTQRLLRAAQNFPQSSAGQALQRLPTTAAEAIGSIILNAADAGLSRQPVSDRDRQTIGSIVDLWIPEDTERNLQASTAARSKRRMVLLSGTALKACELLGRDTPEADDAMLLAGMLGGLATGFFPFLLVGRKLEIRIRSGWFVKLKAQDYRGTISATPLGAKLEGRISQLLYGRWYGYGPVEAEAFVPVAVKGDINARFLNLQDEYWAMAIDELDAALVGDQEIDKTSPAALETWKAGRLIDLASAIDHAAYSFVDIVRDADDPRNLSRTSALNSLREAIRPLRENVQASIETVPGTTVAPSLGPLRLSLAAPVSPIGAKR
ncbi:hypothetical protein ABIG06_001701 [Bradyrhizobium sp. USDA 326]|uniref:hypothetical protein n=1 Tax=Bradyrhizobium sp. USDA 326 TaxID=3377726 RepID=UPI003C7618E8